MCDRLVFGWLLGTLNNMRGLSLSVFVVARVTRGLLARYGVRCIKHVCVVCRVCVCLFIFLSCVVTSDALFCLACCYRRFKTQSFISFVVDFCTFRVSLALFAVQYTQSVDMLFVCLCCCLCPDSILHGPHHYSRFVWSLNFTVLMKTSKTACSYG